MTSHERARRPSEPARGRPSLHVRAYFQHMPPYSGAAALRGASIMSALGGLLHGRSHQISVYTTTPDPDALPGLVVLPLPVAETENALYLILRVFGELRMGWV